MTQLLLLNYYQTTSHPITHMYIFNQPNLHNLSAKLIERKVAIVLIIMIIIHSYKREVSQY